jgi:heme oxygenase
MMLVRSPISPASGTVAMSLRKLLQRETAELHHRLDELASAEGWFDDLPRYGSWLQRTYAFHTQVGRVLAGVNLRGLFDDDRIERLRADIQYLGLKPPTCQARLALHIADRFDALGVLYVTEGATLGARVLLKRVEKLGCHPHSGARYLAAEASNFATWHAVLSALASVDLTGSEISRIVSASVRTFELAVECLHGVRDESSPSL